MPLDRVVGEAVGIVARRGPLSTRPVRLSIVNICRASVADA